MADQKDQGKNLMIGGLGVGVGLIVANLMKPKSAQAAPGVPGEASDSDIRQALAALLLSSQEINSKLDSLNNIQAALQILANVTTPLPGIDKPVTLFNKVITTATPPAVHSDFLIDFRENDRMLIKVESSLDQPIQVQTIGNIFETFDRTTDINGPFNVPAGSNITIGLAWDDWHPFIGLSFSIPVAPTMGRLTAYAVMQRTGSGRRTG